MAERPGHLPGRRWPCGLRPHLGFGGGATVSALDIGLHTKRPLRQPGHQRG